MLCPRCETENPDGANFCSNCGRALIDAHEAGEPLLVWQADSGVARSIPINRPLTIGRSANNDIVIQESGVSRQHARIEILGGEFAAVDLGSLNGTFVNDERIDEPRDLHDGDLLRIGSRTFTAVIPNAEAMREARTVSVQSPYADRPRVDDADDEEAAQPTMYMSARTDVPQPWQDERTILAAAEEAELDEAEADSGLGGDGSEPAQPYLMEGEAHPGDEAQPYGEPEDVVAVQEPEDLVGDQEPEDLVGLQEPDDAGAVSEPEEASAEDERTVMAPAFAEPELAADEPVALEEASQEPQPAGYLVYGETRIPLYSSLSIGRAEGVDVRIDDDRTVSRNHARIEVDEDGSVWLVDNNSANGTYLENERVTGAVPLNCDCTIRFGASTFRFEAIEPLVAEPEAAASGAAAPTATDETLIAAGSGGSTQPVQAARLEFDSSATIEAVASEDQTLQGNGLDLSDMPRPGGPVVTEGGGASPDQYRLIVNFGADAGTAFPLTKDAIVIGRVSPEADYDIQLNDRAVSRPHAKLLRTAQGFSIQDLESANGTWLNYTEEVAGLRPLVDGDIIKAGKTTLVYRVPASIRPAAPEMVLDPNTGQVLTVFSLKGGVGTTTLAVNLAVLLRRLTVQPVLLLDLATEQGAVSVHMNLSPRNTLADLPSDPSIIELFMLQSMVTHHPSGVDVLAAPPSPQSAELVSPASVSAALPILRTHYRWIVVDTGATFSELNLGVLDQSDLLLLTFAPDVASLKVVQSTLDVLAALQTPAEKRVLVLNQVYPKPHLQPADIENTLGERIGLMVPYAEEALLDTIDKGIPLAVDAATHPTVAAIEAFASRLAQINVEAAQQPKRGGFGRWVQGIVSSLRR